MLPSVALPAAFLLSGAAGLIFQIVWFYRCGLEFGSSVAAATVVLSGFMAGLAAGNLLAARFASRLARPVTAYAALEVLVGLAGMLVTYLLPHLGLLLVPIARAADQSGATVNVMRFVIAFVLLVVPASAMGATLPVLVAALCRTGNRFGVALGRLYGWNTLGAVIGVVMAEVTLIPLIGVTGTAWVAAVLDIGAAGVASTVTLRPGQSAEPFSGAADRSGLPGKTGHPGAIRQRTGVVLLAAASVSGAIFLALEVVWFRFLSMYVLVTTLAMSLMLAVVLVGIATGGLAASIWVARRRDVAGTLPVLVCLSGMSVAVSYAIFHVVTAGTQVGRWDGVLWFASVLTLSTAFLSGALFTLIGDALHDRTHGAASTAGRLAAANTIGAVVGPPIAAYVLLPLAGMEGAFFVLALAYGAVGLVVWLGLPIERGRGGAWRGLVLRLGAGVALVAALAAFPFGSMADSYFPRAAAAYAEDGSRIVATREGPSETLFVMQQQWLGEPVYSRLITNGFSMSGTALQGQRYMRAFAYYPMLLHDGPLKRALVICYGVGVTVGAVAHIPSVSSIDVVEISKDVVAMSDAIYPPGARPLTDPRVRLRIEDGRFFLQTTTERFDLITGEPPPPRTPGTVNIYTRDYFRLMHDRLSEGGLATYWVPVARPAPGTDVNTVIRAFCDVFTDCTLWNATPFDLMLVGSRGLSGPRTLEQFSDPWQTPGLEARLREVGFERPEQIGATFIGDAAYLDELTRDVPALTDDFPQRLRPVAGRPSLSDPSYGSDAAVTEMYRRVLDPRRARLAFQASTFVRGIWPPELIERTLPYFDRQAVINRVYWEGARPLRHIEDLDAVLTDTTLRTLPLWMLGSDEVKQRIGETSARAGDNTDGAVDYARGLRALSGRDYAGAAHWLDAAAARGMRGAWLRPLTAYALMKSGRPELARQLAPSAQPADEDERHFWQWLFGKRAG